jgi:hypothetical protein
MGLVMTLVHPHFLTEFKTVYFLGNDVSKKVQASTRAPNNHGYDDERGEYNVVMGDHLLYRYEVLSELGKGSFGVVLKCKDHKTGSEFGIKVIRNKRRFHKQVWCKPFLFPCCSFHACVTAVLGEGANASAPHLLSSLLSSFPSGTCGSVTPRSAPRQ